MRKENRSADSCGKGGSPAEFFFRSCAWDHAGDFPARPEPVPFAEYCYHSRIREYLEKFVTDVTVPDANTTVIEIANGYDGFEVILETETLLVCYHWFTTA